MPLHAPDEAANGDAPSGAAEPLVVSYLALRRAVGLAGLLLPVALWPGAWLVWGVPMQDNMSAYYHTAARDVFVGALCTLGVFLYCYRGHDWAENWSANVGSVAALGVAFFPLDAGKDPLAQQTLSGYLHSVFGAALFLTLAFYSLVHFPSGGWPAWVWRAICRGLASLNTTAPDCPPSERSPAEHEPSDDPSHELERNLIYWGSGVVILASLAAMGVYLLLPTALKAYFNRYHFMFAMEWVALWAFAAAWLTKGRAIVADVAVAALAVPTEFVKRHAGPKQ